MLMRLRVRAESPGLRKAVLVSLATLLVASLAATLSVSAQMNSDESPGDTIEGRVIVRVQDRTGDDGVDDYRIEFGFLPQWAMDEKDPWSEAVATFSDLLPRARYLTKATIEARRDTDNRRWLRSSPVSVPRQGAAQGDTTLSGRVIARYNPDGQGRLRIELGFLPEQAFASTADTEEAVAQYGEQFLPSSRYLTASLIADRRGVWLRSSVVAMHGPVQPPVIESISCSPSPPTVDESVTCTATLSGGAPDTYSWSGGASASSNSTYSTSFSTLGSHTISLTVSNTAGSDDGSTSVNVSAPRFTAVSAGFGYVCGLLTSGAIECWGSNDEGQADAPSGSFVSVSTSPHLHEHTCGVRDGGQIECWATDKPGWKSFGLGDIPAGRFAAVSVGSAYTCGLRDTGMIVCWGANHYGESDAPAGSFAAVSAGPNHACGLRDTGAIVCWGLNDWGQTDAPVGSFTAISAGRQHTCGVRHTGAIECWGLNISGQSAAPDGSYISVSASGSHSCAVRSTGAAVCWGSNTGGDDQPNGKSAAPSGRFTSVSATEWHTCGVRDTGAIECWGSTPSR